MIIAVDFDGTLVENKYPETGALLPAAKDAMVQLKRDGHYIIIWSCRTGELLLNATNFLLENGVPFDRVNDHQPDNGARYGDTGKKIYADVYIDDRHVGGLPEWPQIYKYIKRLAECRPALGRSGDTE